MSTHLRLHTTLMMAVGCGDMISDQVGERWGFHVCSIRLRPVRLCLFELRLALSTYYELRLSLARPDASSLYTLSLFSHHAMLLHFSPPHHHVISHVSVKSLGLNTLGPETGLTLKEQSSMDTLARQSP